MGPRSFAEKNTANHIKGTIVKVVDLISWMPFSLIEFSLWDHFQEIWMSAFSLRFCKSINNQKTPCWKSGRDLPDFNWRNPICFWYIRYLYLHTLHILFTKQRCSVVFVRNGDFRLSGTPHGHATSWQITWKLVPHGLVLPLYASY